eukprot:1252204-Amorphochlora_amoeboformis.AAC.1
MTKEKVSHIHRKISLTMREIMRNGMTYEGAKGTEKGKRKGMETYETRRTNGNIMTGGGFLPRHAEKGLEETDGEIEGTRRSRHTERNRT